MAGDTGVFQTVVCILVLVLISHGAAKSEEEECGVAADIVFVMDSSRSIWKYDFFKEMAFVNALVDLFHVEPGKTQVAVLQYSEYVTIEFNLIDGTDATDVKLKVNATEQSLGGQTNTHKALKAARTSMFQPASGSRPDVSKIIILLSDGQSTNMKETQKEAKLVREAGITLLAIGIGNSINQYELKAAVSPPSEENYFYAPSFAKLEDPDFQALVGQKACDINKQHAGRLLAFATPCEPNPCLHGTCSPKGGSAYACTCDTGYVGKNCDEEQPEVPEEINEEPEKTCQGKEADVVFVLDMSSSIWPVHFQEQLMFVSEVVDVFDVDSGKTRVGALVFSNAADIVFDLDTYHTKDGVIVAVQGIRQLGGITNTHLALKTVLDDMFTKEGGSRPGVAHICIVITDGVSRLQYATEELAKEAHERGIYMFAMGVGNRTDPVELAAIASNPDKDFLFEVNGYDALPRFRDILAYRTCTVESEDKQGSGKMPMKPGKPGKPVINQQRSKIYDLLVQLEEKLRDRDFI